MATEAYILCKLKPEIAARRGLPVNSFPVRESRRDAIFGARVDLEGLIGELEHFVREHPKSADVYAPAIAELAFLEGRAHAMDGRLSAAERMFDLGLRYVPTHPRLLANHAVALHMGGQPAEALAKYEAAIENSPAPVEPIIRMFAARAARACDEPEKAVALMEGCPLMMFASDEFASFYADIADVAPPVPERETPPPRPPRVETPPPAPPEAKASTRPPPPPQVPGSSGKALDFCTNCATPRSPDDTVCSYCGAPLT